LSTSSLISARLLASAAPLRPVPVRAPHTRSNAGRKGTRARDEVSAGKVARIRHPLKTRTDRELCHEIALERLERGRGRHGRARARAPFVGLHAETEPETALARIGGAWPVRRRGTGAKSHRCP
jgi:hypothetical protein